MQILLSIFILVLPLNLFYKLNVEHSFVSGLQIDYLINKLYLADILLGIVLLIWLGIFFWQNRSKKLGKVISAKISNITSGHDFLPVLILLSAVVIRQAISARPAVAFFFLFNLISTGLWVFFLTRKKSWLKHKLIIWSIAGAFLLQFFLGAYQFVAQQPLLPYRFLGEPSFTSYYRLSRHIFDGKEKILAYGSTAHPNILASTLVIFFLILASRLNPFTKSHASRKNRLILALFFLLCLIGIYLTQARAAIFTLVLGCLLLWQKQLALQLSTKTQKILLAAILMVVPILLAMMAPTHGYQPSINRRHILNHAAVKMILDQPFLGQGFNHFTVYLEEFSRNPEAIRFVQPAHHVGLLFLAETGLLGVLTLLFIFRSLKERSQEKVITTLLILSPILSSDHFFYSLQPGRLLLVFFLLAINLPQVPE